MQPFSRQASPSKPRDPKRKRLWPGALLLLSRAPQAQIRGRGAGGGRVCEGGVGVTSHGELRVLRGQKMDCQLQPRLRNTSSYLCNLFLDSQQWICNTSEVPICFSKRTCFSNLDRPKSLQKAGVSTVMMTHAAFQINKTWSIWNISNQDWLKHPKHKKKKHSSSFALVQLCAAV